MLTRIHIANFQSLEDVKLDLGPLTVLVGPSNSGKSAVRRAMEGLLRNDSAAGKVRAGAKSLSVRVVSVDEAEAVDVLWRKGEKLNTYGVDTDEGWLDIDKPGATIPTRAEEALGWIDLDLSFSSQFDAPFLLNETPGKVATALGDLTNIRVLYDGIREANRRKASYSKVAKTLADTAEGTAAQLVDYHDLVEEGPRLERASAALQQATEANRTAEATALALQAALVAQGALLAARETLVGLPDVERAQGILGEAEAKLAESNAWAGVHRQAVGLQQTIQQAQTVLATTPRPPIFTEAESAVIALGRAQEAHAAAALLVGRVTQAQLDARNWLRAEVAANDTIQAEFPTCPVCGGAL